MLNALCVLRDNNLRDNARKPIEKTVFFSESSSDFVLTHNNIFCKFLQLPMGTLKFEDGDNTWTRDGAIVKTALILGATDTMTTREKISSLCRNTWKLFGLLLLLFPSHVFAALPTGSYLRFSRPEHCGGIDFGDGQGLPDGDFTLSVWLTLEGGYERRTVLDSNYKFDFISKFTKVDDGYVDTLFFGGTSYTSLPM